MQKQNNPMKIFPLSFPEKLSSHDDMRSYLPPQVLVAEDGDGRLEVEREAESGAAAIRHATSVSKLQVADALVRRDHLSAGRHVRFSTRPSKLRF